MFSSLWIKSTLSLLFIAVIMVVGCKMMKMAGCNARPPRIVTAGPFAVLSVQTGASIEYIKRGSGKRDRQIGTVQLQYVQAPASGQWAQISADHLKEIAGPTITVQYEKRGLFRGTPEEETADIYARNLAWSNNHLKTCPICSTPGDDGELQRCVEYFDHISDEIEEAQVRQRRREEGCDDTADNDAGNPFEARGPIIGIVFGASRINLNLAQIEGGYGSATTDAPKEYKAAEKKAQKAKTGIWSVKK